MSGDTCISEALIVERVPVLQDNYLWVLHEPKSQRTAIVDTTNELQPVINLLEQR
jgi:hypothetical protein